MIFYYKTFEIMETIFPDENNETANILTLIGLIYSYQQEADLA
jgi:hypothetical protein